MAFGPAALNPAEGLGRMSPVIHQQSGATLIKCPRAHPGRCTGPHPPSPRRLPFLVTASLILFIFHLSLDVAVAATLLPLNAGWKLSSSAALRPADSGASISVASYNDTTWLPLAQFPTTVLAAVASNGSMPASDFMLPLLYGRALNATDTALFDVPWWYRVDLPAEVTVAVAAGRRAVLTFKGINYRANVWCAGRLVAAASDTEGAFEYHDLDVTEALAALATAASGPAPSALAVEVFRSYDWGLDCKATAPLNEQVSCRGKPEAESLDLGITFVDWAPAPNDANMGLWRGVDLTLTESAAAVTIRYPQINTTLVQAGLEAKFEIVAEVQNWDPENSISGTVEAQIGTMAGARQQVKIAAGRTVQVLLTAVSHGIVPERDLWWPWQMGNATQHNLTITFNAHAAAAPAATLTALVGLRQVTAANDDNGNMVLRVNGRRILVRGGGWAPDLLQRDTPRRNAQQLLLTKDLGLNAIRLEGKLKDDDLFQQASALGIMMLPGLCCCDAWQQWALWTNRTYAVAMRSMASQLKRLRGHASVVLFLYSSDELPTPSVEAGYLKVFAAERWAVGKLQSAADTHSTLTGGSGVKMAGPYGWVPPNYWYTNATTRDFGSAYGFATEISPGAAPLTLDSMRKIMPASALWDPSSPDGGPTPDWVYHCGTKFGAFGSLKHFTPGLNARYSSGISAADYLKKAQLAAYESHRAMFEGYSRNKYNSTGIIQWMLNSAWPSNMWHLYDYFLQVGGSGFGAKKAIAQPLHLLYAYDRPAVSPDTGGYDIAKVLHTDPHEGGYKTLVAADPDTCCSLCLTDANCTHAVHSAGGQCLLKKMRLNDEGNTMPPIVSASGPGQDRTLCLKRKQRPSGGDRQGKAQPPPTGGTIAVVNSRYQPDGHGLTAEATQYDLAGRVLHIQRQVLATPVEADGTLHLFALEGSGGRRRDDIQGNSSSSYKRGNATVLLRLRFLERNGTDNWYWLPHAPDRFEMGGCYTGCVMDAFADMRDLAAMPRSPAISITLGAPAAIAGGRVRRTVTVAVAAADAHPPAGDAGSGLAFFVRLRALDGDGNDVLPATWSDNFITLPASSSTTVALEHEGEIVVAMVTAEPFNGQPPVATDLVRANH